MVKINKIKRWFYKRDKAKMIREIEEYGLQIIDQDKFEKHINQAVRRNMIYTVVFLFLIIWIIIRWIQRLSGG